MSQLLDSLELFELTREQLITKSEHTEQRAAALEQENKTLRGVLEKAESILHIAALWDAYSDAWGPESGGEELVYMVQQATDWMGSYAALAAAPQEGKK